MILSCEMIFVFSSVNLRCSIYSFVISLWTIVWSSVLSQTYTFSRIVCFPFQGLPFTSLPWVRQSILRPQDDLSAYASHCCNESQSRCSKLLSL